MRRRGTLACALLVCAALPAGSIAAATASAPKPPGVYTGGYTTSGSTVTLKGGVNPHGLATVYAFQFGTTTGYGAQTAPVSVGNGTTTVAVSQTIAGLPAGATYHYRIIATNGAGTTNGKDATFLKKIPLTFKLTGTPNPVVFDGPFTLSGVLSGTGAAGAAVVLQADPYPYLAGFQTTTSPVPTNASGQFSFPIVNLTENTRFRVAVAGIHPIYSPDVLARVAVRVSMHLRSTDRPGYVRMSGTVTPAGPGARVAFQLMRPELTPLTVASTIVKSSSTSASRFSRVVRIRHGGLYRALVSVNTGKQISGHSRALLIR